MYRKLTLLLLICMGIAFAGEIYLKDKPAHTLNTLPNQLLSKVGLSSHYGFTKMPEGSYPADADVIIHNARNPGKNTLKRTQEIIKFLKENEISYKEANNFSFDAPAGTDPFLVRKINVIFSSEGPIVMVKGWVKSNPSTDDIIHLYNTKN